MDKKKKLIIGGVVLAGLAYFFFFRKSKGTGSVEEVLNINRGTVTGGPAKGAGKGNWIGVYRQADRDAITNVLFVGDVISVGGQVCTVSELWTDKNGKTSAIRCEEIPLGEYNFPEGTKITY
tara:strand:- start:11 stop:376 length:366 start_codon:yes stop_codon:yes gene_type:complete